LTENKPFLSDFVFPSETQAVESVGATPTEFNNTHSQTVRALERPEAEFRFTSEAKPKMV